MKRASFVYVLAIAVSLPTLSSGWAETGGRVEPETSDVGTVSDFLRPVGPPVDPPRRIDIVHMQLGQGVEGELRIHGSFDDGKLSYEGRLK